MQFMSMVCKWCSWLRHLTMMLCPKTQIYKESSSITINYLCFGLLSANQFELFPLWCDRFLLCSPGLWLTWDQFNFFCPLWVKIQVLDFSLKVTSKSNNHGLPRITCLIVLMASTSHQILSLYVANFTGTRHLSFTSIDIVLTQETL